MAANYIPLRVLADCNQDSAKRKEKRNFVSVGVGTLVFIPDALGLQADGPTVVAVPGAPALVLGNFDLTCLGYATAEFFTSGTASSYKLVDLRERFYPTRMEPSPAIPPAQTRTPRYLAQVELHHQTQQLLICTINFACSLSIPLSDIIQHGELLDAVMQKSGTRLARRSWRGRF